MKNFVIRQTDDKENGVNGSDKENSVNVSDKAGTAGESGTQSSENKNPDTEGRNHDHPGSDIMNHRERDLGSTETISGTISNNTKIQNSGVENPGMMDAKNWMFQAHKTRIVKIKIQE